MVILQNRRTGPCKMVTALILACTILLSCCFAESLTNQEKLDTALENLNNYLA